MLRAVAGKDVVVTLLGESGTGKELMARRLHALSGRSDGPFVPINCAAIPDSLFESELFGHERGAFTGAGERVRGKIEAAEGGTLFLDEIGELPFGAQAKLLRFLDGRRFMRVGGTRKLHADVRLVCATLRPLVEDVANGRFRADLYYRIQGITIEVPPLRERREDIGPLVDLLLREAAERHGVPPTRIGRALRTRFFLHGWPGNIRELKNVIEMLCLLRSGREARAMDLPPTFTEPTRAPKAEMTISLDTPLDTTVRSIVAAALEAEGGNRARTARRLGISVRTVQRHLHGRSAPTRARTRAR